MKNGYDFHEELVWNAVDDDDLKIPMWREDDDVHTVKILTRHSNGPCFIPDAADAITSATKQ